MAWSHQSRIRHGGHLDIERVKQSGDIFHFTAVMKGNNVASLIADISEGYESFDIKRTIAEWRRMDATISLDDYIRDFVDFDLVRKDLWTLAGDLARAFRNCPIREGYFENFSARFSRTRPTLYIKT